MKELLQRRAGRCPPGRAAREHGGLGLGVVEQFIMREEFAEVGAPMPREGVAAAALMMYGSDAIKQRYLPPMARGEERWCQGFSEPGAGSDLALRSPPWPLPTAMSTWSMARRPGPRTRMSRSSCSPWCAPTATLPSTVASAC
ncbi:MAG: acyl-CoA dehydrogenase family protein [Dehalococcoidia bacterium]